MVGRMVTRIPSSATLLERTLEDRDEHKALASIHRLLHYHS